MEALIHNLNTMHSRAGAQTPFCSINYGMDTSPEGRMVMKNLLLATEAGLGNGETPIFPIQIFRVKEGVNYNPGEPNYDLFKLAMPLLARSACSRISRFQDAPFNLQYYKRARPRPRSPTWAAARASWATSTIPTARSRHGRGNLSFTSINLPRLAIQREGRPRPVLRRSLDADARRSSSASSIERFEIQARKTRVQLPLPDGPGRVDRLREARLGTTRCARCSSTARSRVGFIGLAETLDGADRRSITARAPRHRRTLGLEIIGHMRGCLDRQSARSAA